MQNLATPGSPRFPKIHKFCVLYGFCHFLEKNEFSKNFWFFGHFSIIYHGQGHGKFLPSKYLPLVNYLPMVNNSPDYSPLVKNIYQSGKYSPSIYQWWILFTSGKYYSPEDSPLVNFYTENLPMVKFTKVSGTGP